MADDESHVSRAATLHRQAAAVLAAADAGLHALTPAPADLREQRDLAARLTTAAAHLAPGWLGADLATSAPEKTGRTEEAGAARFVRVGTARPLPEASFPTIVPLIGAGHLTIDADARDPRAAALLRSVLLRLLAAFPPGDLLIRAVDGDQRTRAFTPFALLADAGLLPPPAEDAGGLRAVLDEAERWLDRHDRAREKKRDRPGRMLVLAVAAFPDDATATDLLRFRGLAERGPGARLHLLIAGWPPPALATGIPAQPLPLSTPVTLREAYAIVGDPPGASFAAQPNDVGLNSPVLLDPDPPAELVARVCRTLADDLLVFDRPALPDLLPAKLWTEDGADGLATTVGRDGERPVTVPLTDLAPNWLVGGRPGAGKSAFLTAALAGLTARYSPDDLALYLINVDLPDGERECLPHLRAHATTEAEARAVLSDLAEQVAQRTALAEEHGTTRYSDLHPKIQQPRLVCVIDEFTPYLKSEDTETLLTVLSRGGRACGIHLILASRTPRALPRLHDRDGLFAQWTVRIALPGGADVLEPANDSALSLPIGTAVVNTAGGLGGPRGATRGHERLVRFPDPRADDSGLSELYSRLSAAAEQRRDDARPTLTEDPAYRAALTAADAPPKPRSARRRQPETPPIPGTETTAALLGRPLDAAHSPPPPVSFPLDTAPGRHLAVIGSGSAAPDLLNAATRSVSAHHAPGTARFLLCALLGEGDRHVAALAAALARRHEVEVLDAPGLAKALELDEPAYLVVFGMDAGDRAALPPDRLARLLATGSPRGVHVLSWWRGPARLTGDLSAAAESISGLALLGVPSAEVAALLGEETPPGRPTLFHDRRTGTTTPFIPFRTEPAGSVPSPRSTGQQRMEHSEPGEQSPQTAEAREP